MSKLPCKVFAIHGFLGLPSDWAGFDVEPVSIGTADSIEAWAKHFNDRVRREKVRRIVVGYSMGGRLALHALVQEPELWEKAILVSTHKGIEADKETRLKNDEAWALRFERDPWYEVVADWMAQPIFKGTSGPLRVESDFNRSELASHLRNFSLAKQAPLDHEKAVWVVGERDEAYRKLHPEAIVVPNAGHRILFDNPQKLNEIICNFTTV